MCPSKICSIAWLILLMLPVIAGAAGIPADEAGRCRYGAEHMIEFARQSLSEPRSRPERVEKRRKLVEDWTARLEHGDDPCAVYVDIQRAATTF